MVTSLSYNSESKQNADFRGDRTLSVENLKKTYRSEGKILEAVRNVSFNLAAGEVLAFLGPNGAGKTTTIKMIAGLIRPDSGRVLIDGLDPHTNSRALGLLGAVLEGNRNLYWRLNPIENLEYFGVLKGLNIPEARRRGKELLERFELGFKRHTTVQELSRGMQQKLAIAVALIHRPRLLLLDEPTLGLDVEATENVKVLVRAIASSGCAILLTTHQLDIAEELSDRVAIVRNGKIIAHETTTELLKQFSGNTYIIDVDGEIEPQRANALREVDAQIQSSRVIYLGSTEGLYRVLKILEPLPLIQVKKDSADLTTVFLKLVREGKDV